MPIVFRRIDKRVAKSRLGGVGGSAKFSREAASFFFKLADRELDTTGAVAEILATPLFQSAGALALRNVNEVMQNRFTIMPCVHPDN